MRLELALGVLLVMAAGSAHAAAPDRPTNLEAADISPTQIALTWSIPGDGGSPLTGFKIEARTPPGNFYVVTSDTESTSPTYTHGNLDTGKQYVYRVYAINADGTGRASTEATATPSESSSSDAKPAAPTNLMADDTSPKKIELAWKAPERGAYAEVTGYKIEQKLDSGNYKILVNDTGDTDTTHTISNAKTNAMHTFRVFALNPAGFGPSSGEASVTPTSDSAPKLDKIVPNRPTKLKATALSPTEILLSWKAPNPNNSPQVTGYQIEAKLNNGSYELVKDDHDTLSFAHKNLEPGATYTYRVAARNEVGLGGTASASEQPRHTNAPTRLTLTELSPTQARLEWDPPSQTFGLAISGYEIKERIAPDTYQTIGTSDTALYELDDLKTGKTYYYVIVASLAGSGTSSPMSDEIDVKLTETSGAEQPDAPSKPINLQASASSPIQVDLTWSKPADDGGAPVTGYRIELSIGGAKYITLVEDTGSQSRVYYHTERVPNTTYSYKVYAINEAGTGQASNEASATPSETEPEPPAGPPSPPLLSAELEGKSIHISWTKPADDGGAIISGYRLEVKQDSGGYEMLTESTGRKSYTHDVEPENATYTYRVYALNSAGASEPSDEAAISIEIEPKEPADPRLRVKGFPDPAVKPQSYIDRYKNDTAFRDWFEMVFPEYTIYEYFEVEEPLDRAKYYTERYESESSYRTWFRGYFGNAAISDLLPSEPSFGLCGEGTELKDGICQIRIK